jgi:hypothetical protein
VADPGLTPSKARFVRITDPMGVQIEIMQFGPDSLQRKARWVEVAPLAGLGRSPVDRTRGASSAAMPLTSR